MPREIRVLVAAAFVIAIGFGLVAPALPQFARSFDVSVSVATLVISAFAAMRLGFAPVGGSLVDRLGERRVFLSGLMLVGLSTGACAFAQTFTQLLMFRAFGGIGSVMFTISSSALIVRLSPPEIRGRTSSAYASSFLIGGIIGPVLGGALGSLGLRAPFVVYAVAILIALLVVAALLPRTVAPSQTASSEVREAMTFREAIRSRAYVAALISNFAGGGANFGVRVALVPLFVKAAFGAGPELIGVVLAAYAVGNASALLWSGRVADRVGRKPMLVAGLVLSGTATIVGGWASSPALFLVTGVVAGFGSGMFSPAHQATVADVIGHERAGGKVLAAFQMAADLGTITVPMLAGVIVDHVAYGWAFVLTGVLLLGAAVVWVFAPETLHDARAEIEVARARALGADVAEAHGEGDTPPRRCLDHGDTSPRRCLDHDECRAEAGVRRVGPR